MRLNDGMGLRLGSINSNIKGEDKKFMKNLLTSRRTGNDYSLEEINSFLREIGIYNSVDKLFNGVLNYRDIYRRRLAEAKAMEEEFAKLADQNKRLRSENNRLRSQLLAIKYAESDLRRCSPSERDKRVMEMLNAGMSYRDIESRFGISKTTVYNIKKRMGV